MLVDKMNATILSDRDKQIVNRCEASQSNKVLRIMVSQRLANYDVDELTIEEV